MNQKISVRLIVLMALAVLGLGCSISLSQHFYDLRSGAAGFKSYCDVSAKINCDVVAASTWAEIIPGLPISSVAAGWYAGLFFIYLTAIGFTVRREALKIALILGGIAAVASLFYLYIMSARIGTYCLLCLGLDAINFVSLGLVYSLVPPGRSSADPQKPSFPHWKGFAAIMIVAIFIAVVGLKGLDTLAEAGGAQGSSTQEAAQAILMRDPVAVTLNPSDLSIGPANAPITLVEFSDFQCPFCRVGAFTLHAVMSRFPKQIRIVMKPFPLDPSCNRFVNHAMHPVACEAARSAVCASAQGLFEPLYESLFQNQENLSQIKPASLAKDAGVNLTTFNACMSNNDSLVQVQASIEEGNRLNVNSTPTFYINGYRIEGVVPLPVWSEVINRLLAAAQSSQLHQ
jgi:protein-disulfide isomerase/uncharacterized membrane protein